MYEHGLRLPHGSRAHLPCCGVVAISAAAEVPFQTTWNLLAPKMRKTWRGRLFDEVVTETLQKLHVSFKVIPIKFLMSLRDFAHLSAVNNPGKVYIIRTPGHFIMVRNNEVVDQYGVMDVEASRFRRCIVKTIWEIVSNNPDKAVDVKHEISYTSPANATTNRKKNQMSKIDQAKALYAANPTLVRKEMIALFVAELGLTPAAASTYQNTAKKAYEASKDTTTVVETAPIAEEVKTELKEAAVKNVKKSNVRVSTGGNAAPMHNFTKDEILEVLDPATRAEVERLEKVQQEVRDNMTAN